MMEGRAGRQGFHAEGYGLPTGWTPDLVEERLVEAWGFLRRMPGGGGRAGASDGPWHLIQKEWGDYVDLDEVREREARQRGALRPAEVDRMNEALEWVRYASASDVRLLALVLAALDREGTPMWADIAHRSRLMTRFGRAIGGDAARMRYNRALHAIARALNAAEKRGATCQRGELSGGEIKDVRLPS